MAHRLITTIKNAKDPVDLAIALNEANKKKIWWKGYANFKSFAEDLGINGRKAYS